jgi:hypothetical protein
MNIVKSVKVNGSEIYVFKSDLYLFELDGEYDLNLVLIVSEDDEEKFNGGKKVNVEILTYDGREFNLEMSSNIRNTSIPVLYFAASIENIDDYKNIDIVNSDQMNERDALLERDITLADIRKVKMPYREYDIELTLPIDQIEWLHDKDKDQISKIIEEALYKYMRS